MIVIRNLYNRYIIQMCMTINLYNRNIGSFIELIQKVILICLKYIDLNLLDKIECE